MLETAREELVALEAQVAKEKKMTASCKEIIAKFKKVLNLCKPALTTLKEKWVTTEKVVKATEEKAATVEASARDFAAWAIIDFKKSQDFTEAITKGSTKAYQLGFEDCKACLKHVVPKLDLRHLCPDNNDDSIRAFSLDKD